MALYSGISASIVRQLTYSSLRFGVYEEVKYRVGSHSRKARTYSHGWVLWLRGRARGKLRRCAERTNAE